MFQTSLSGVLQASILGSILFNIFVKNLFLCLSKTDFRNFADDNTISAFGKTIKKLIKILEDENKLPTQAAFICSKFNIFVKIKYFTPCSSVSIVNFEHVIAGWV